MSVLYLREAEVAELLTPAAAIEAVEGALRRIAQGEVENPPRSRLALPDGQYAVMPCVDRGLGLAGLKSYAWTGGGSSFVVALFAIEDGRLEAVVEADVLGRLRTGAASAVAARRLARAGASSLGLVGAGRQAASHLACLRVALPGLERALVAGRDPGHVEAFCAAHGCEPAGVQQVAAQDVVVTVTTSRDPVLRGEWLRPGALVCAVGANDPSARELDNAVLERAAFVCCDSRAQSMLEAGDLIEPVEQGVLDWLEVYELHELYAGEVEGRSRDEDVVLFKSNGMAAWDLAAAAAVLDEARRLGLGLAV